MCLEIPLPYLKFIALSDLSIIILLGGEGNGNPLQNSCLENPMDREAWWATDHSGGHRVGHSWVTNT